MLVIQWINTCQQVTHDLVGNLLLGRIVDMQEVGNGVPEALQCLIDLRKDGFAVLIVLGNLAQALIASMTAELSQNLIGYLVLSQEPGIVTTYLIPKLRTCFQQSFDVFPFLGIHPTHRIGPQVGILVNRRL